MRPESAKYQIEKSIYLALKGNTKHINSPKTMRAILSLMKKCRLGGDFFIDDYTIDAYTPNWTDEMEYISDRFNCMHRLKWLQQGIEYGVFRPFMVATVPTYESYIEKKFSNEALNQAVDNVADQMRATIGKQLEREVFDKLASRVLKNSVYGIYNGETIKEANLQDQ